MALSVDLLVDNDRDRDASVPKVSAGENFLRTLWGLTQALSLP
jgi:hypothetical protein